MLPSSTTTQCLFQTLAVGYMNHCLPFNFVKGHLSHISDSSLSQPKLLCQPILHRHGQDTRHNSVRTLQRRHDIFLCVFQCVFWSALAVYDTCKTPLRFLECPRFLEVKQSNWHLLVFIAHALNISKQISLMYPNRGHLQLYAKCTLIILSICILLPCSAKNVSLL